MNRRTLRSLILLIGIATGIMLGVALSTRGGVQPETGGGGAVWTSKRVVVRIYTSDAWRPLVLQSVEDWDAILVAAGAAKTAWEAAHGVTLPAVDQLEIVL